MSLLTPLLNTKLSIVYLNTSNSAIGQAVLTNGVWEVSNPQPAELPADNTKLSISTHMLPGNESNFTFPFSSKLVFQRKNASLFMMDIAPDQLQVMDSPNLIEYPDVVTDTRFPALTANTTGIGFSCPVDCPSPAGVEIGLHKRLQTSLLFAQCVFASSDSASRDSIWGLGAQYNSPVETYNKLNLTAHGSFLGSGATGLYSQTFSLATDIISLVYSWLNPIAVYINANNGIVVASTETFGGLDDVTPPSVSMTVLFRHIGAVAGEDNSTLIYLYYQMNETHFGETIYNQNTQAWSAQPNFIQIS